MAIIDERLQNVKNEEAETINKYNNTYNEMIDSSETRYNELIENSKNWSEKQQEIQQNQSDFLVEQQNQQKEQTEKNYNKEQNAAYVDYQKETNKFGVNAEQMAANGLSNSGYSESSKVALFTAYQNRKAIAKETLENSVLNYNNSIREIRLQNDSNLAQIAQNSLKEQIELSNAALQYKNSIISEKQNQELQIRNFYNNKYQNTMNLINMENEFALKKEQIELEKQKTAKELELTNAQIAKLNADTSATKASEKAYIFNGGNEQSKPTTKASFAETLLSKLLNSGKVWTTDSLETQLQSYKNNGKITSSEKDDILSTLRSAGLYTFTSVKDWNKKYGK